MKELEDVIRKTISAVETIAPRAWDLLVQEQRIQGLVEIVKDGGSLIVLPLIMWATWKLTAHEDPDEPLRWVPRMIAAFICLPAFCLAIFSFPGDYMRYSHPEPFAARALIDGVSK